MKASEMGWCAAGVVILALLLLVVGILHHAPVWGAVFCVGGLVVATVLFKLAEKLRWAKSVRCQTYRGMLR